MNPFELDHIKFDFKDDSYYFVRMIGDKHLYCWKEEIVTSSGGSCVALGLPVSFFNREILETIEVWKDLDTQTQMEVENKNSQSQEALCSKMEKARKARRKKYENIPREVTCTKCGAVQKISPGVVAARVQKLGILLDDWIKDFQCQKCRPTKGRKANPKFKDLPEMLTCKCGASVKANYSYLSKKAKAKRIPLQKLIDEYQCQKCNPTKGRKKGTKVKKAKKPKKNKQRQKM